jgi:polar amino acid transport system permease protein
MTGGFGDAWLLLPVLGRGLLETIRIALASIAFALPVGLLVGMARHARNRAFSWPARLYIELFRNTPILVLIIWFFFAFPILAPFELGGFGAVWLALALNSSAFFAEIFRAGIQSLPRGQWEAARALGMGYGAQMRIVILPQAFRRMIPALTNRWIELFKLTSLAAAIAHPELLHTARLIATAYYNPLEAFTLAALIYFAVVYPMSHATYWLERRLSRSDRGAA